MPECVRDGCHEEQCDSPGSLGRFCSEECYRLWTQNRSVSFDAESIARNITGGKK